MVAILVRWKGELPRDKVPQETLEFPSLCLKVDSDPSIVFKPSNDWARRVTAGWRGGSMGEGLALKAWAPEFR